MFSNRYSYRLALCLVFVHLALMSCSNAMTKLMESPDDMSRRKAEAAQQVAEAEAQRSIVGRMAFWALKKADPTGPRGGPIIIGFIILVLATKTFNKRFRFPAALGFGLLLAMAGGYGATPPL